jgi:hypothetical protein
VDSAHIQGIRDLAGMPPLNSSPTTLAATDLHLDLEDLGAYLRYIDLVLALFVLQLHRRLTLRTVEQTTGQNLFVHLLGHSSLCCLTVVFAWLAPGFLGLGLGWTFGEWGCLSFATAPQALYFLLQLFDALCLLLHEALEFVVGLK